MIVLDNSFIKTLFLRAQFLLGFLFFAFSCSDRLKEFQINGETMGTTYSIKLIVSENIEDQWGIKNSVDSILISINQQMSTWIPNSEISIFNNTRTTDYFEVSDDFYYVLEQGKAISEKTSNFFDYTVFPLARAWGFGPKKNKRGYNPSYNEIKEILLYTGIHRIELKYPFLKKTHPSVQLDLNAIAKGYAVDLVHSWLVDQGFANVFVEIGGEIRCLGVNKTGNSWVVGIDTPSDGLSSGQNIFTSISLKNMSLATSGNYRNYYENNGNKINHSINPINGKPVNNNILSVSVKSKSCLDADAWATALMVMSFEEGIEKVNEFKELEALWIILDNDSNLTHFSSRGFYN